MDLLCSCLCFPTSSSHSPSKHLPQSSTIKKPNSHPTMSEKTNQYPSKPPPPTTTRTQDEAVTALISAFQKHEKISHELRTAVNEIEISCGGWTEYIAQKIIETVQDIVKGGGFLLGVLDGAYKKAQAAMEGVEGFVKDHPVWAAAVIAVLALGICYVLLPWVLEAVGFGQIGPRAGKGNINPVFFFFFFFFFGNGVLILDRVLGS